MKKVTTPKMPSMWAMMKRQRQDIRKDKQKRIFWASGFNMVVAGAIPALAVLLPMVIIDQLSSPNTNQLILYIVIFAGVSAILYIISAFLKAIVNGSALSVRMNRFIDFNRKFLALDYKYMEDNPFLDKMYASLRCLNNDNTGYEGIMHTMFSMLPLFFSAALYVALLGTYNAWVIIACFFGAGVSVVGNMMANRYQYKKKDELEHALRKTNYLNDVAFDFTYGKDIRMFNLNEKLRKDFRNSANSFFKIYGDIKAHAFGWAMLDILMLLIQDGLAYFLIISGYYKGEMSLGTMSAYIGAVIALTTSLKAISKYFADLHDYTRYMGDFYHFMDDQTLFSYQGKKTRLDGSFTVEFKDVSFKYPHSDVYALRHLNLRLEKGEKLALVGANGAGKTTLVKLLTGLFVPDEGQILLDGVDIKEFSQKELQAMFGVVFQDFTIYAASVLENVKGDDAQGKELAMQAIASVGLQKKVESLPHKEDTSLLKVIDEEGTLLSGGETQKLAIARALYKDSNMIILDEPTSALDALAEEAIYRDFDQLVKHKTAIYISHRLSSTKFCDHIALLTSKGLAEYGTHDELMAQKGLYYEMFVTQGKYYQEKESDHEER